MKQQIKYFLFVMLLFATVSGCQAVTGRTAGENLDDANITASVNATLVADKASNFTRIDVDTNRGVVSLSGTVESNTHRARAEELARRVDGVKTVVNNLQVAAR